jgi:hypothetical protein
MVAALSHVDGMSMQRKGVHPACEMHAMFNVW